MTLPKQNVSRAAIAALALGLPAAFLTPVGPVNAAPTVSSRPATAPISAAKLDLGASDLPEKRADTTLAPGLTRTSITRGAPDASLFWTAEVAIPANSPDPDAPASALSDQVHAQAVAAKLQAAGIQARVEHVQSPQLADAGGDLGYRVRAGQFPSKADGTATVAQIKAAGYASSVLYTGWDGDAETSGQTRGPWKLEVLTIDPKKFRGELSSSFGPNLQDRETTSALAAADGALAATNGGYFVLDPKAGAPGDPAGTAVANGKILSEPVGDRPSLVIDGTTNRSSVQRLHWDGTVTAPGKAKLAVDGLNRVPGLIRNCGGTDDAPTSLPVHDATCTDPDEIVGFTPEFAASTPSGPGLEVVLDERGTVTAVNTSRGMAVPAHGRTLQAIGADVQRLKSVAKVGTRIELDTDLINEQGKPLKAGSSTDVVNGGPVLVSGGQEKITAKRDGMVHAGDSNSFYYGWVHKRNPRTIAGVDAQGRTLIVTADGRQTTALGLSIKESADVARSLGMVDAINMDGGGSTTMVVGGKVVNSPSDAAGERPVGDALLVLPRRKD
ncbi:hypothetical protein SRABI83_03897 [Arthrobacter sp. Bi83]|jgi:exopolysaccharide biosynthesis protein|uniref:phosphodiester glycosidase family protein n=1 Tax=Arthrobacter sp. Bi83 TaxID=2822353 RepID=UPI001D7F9FE1|nr:phosphodiester glycosidase family protein [Arthrobacter sp. Bi83]CAH0280067.1 hypothetical protein SRABI83_03897 [Arthrobacter sp. Bi83]